LNKAKSSVTFNLNLFRVLLVADKNGIKFLETSAKETTNIDELFISATRSFLDKQSTIGNKSQKKAPGSSISLNDKPDQKNQKNQTNNQEGCC